MSESDEAKPLSRRERRLREMAQADTTAAAEVADASAEAATGEPHDLPDFEPEISPLAPDGRIRSRREIRELREQAIEEYRKQHAGQQASAQETTAEPEQAGLPELGDAPTQAYSLEDLEEATVAGSETKRQKKQKKRKGGAEVDSIAAAVPSAPTSPDADAEDIEDVEAFDERQPDAERGAADSIDELFPEGEPETELDAEAAADEAAELDAVELETAEAADVADAEVYEEDDAESETDAAAAGGYSFPDIAPLDEGGSVFDDPEARTAATAESDPEQHPEGEGVGSGTRESNGQPGDFDDLITSAVAQEGSGSTSNTSALILPGIGNQLSGPLGETGELFVTGSYELPKSLGETGGHARLIDSVNDDDTDLPAAARAPGDDDGLAPVAAAKAVSARSTTSMVASPEKGKSRLPVALIATGGGLLVVIAGLAIWAATTGFFA